MLFIAPQQILLAKSVSSLAKVKAKKSLKKTQEVLVNNFRVVKVEGFIEYRDPLDLAWHTLQVGQKLVVGSYLSIPGGSKLRLSYVFRNRGKLRSEETVINFNNTITIRLTRETLRRIVIDEYFMSRLPDLKTDSKKMIEDENVMFDRAWEKITILFRPNEANDQIVAKYVHGANQMVEIGLRHKKITILYPENGAALMLPSFPAKLNIIWVHPELKPLKYKIYLWQKETDFKSPSLVTYADNAQIDIAEPGTYYVMVRDATGKYSSAPHIVYIEKDIPQYGAALNTAEMTGINLLKPDNAFLLLSLNKNKIDFNWIIGEKLVVKKLEFNFVNAATEKSAKITLENDQRQLTRVLAPGHYIWWLDVFTENPTDKTLKVISSEKRQVMIIDTKNSFKTTKNLLKKYVDELVQENHQYNIMIRHGL